MALNLDFIKLFENRNEKIWIENDVIFRMYNKMLIPEISIKEDAILTFEKAQNLLIQSKALMIRTTSNFDCSEKDSEWYALICEKFTHLDEMSSKYRYEINKGLKKCEVKKLNCEEFAKDGYDCYINTVNNYKNNKMHIMSRDEFENRILCSQNLDNINQFWGAYADNKLVAYAIVYLYDGECSYDVFKIKPDYLKFFPMYALLYKMNEYYLGEKNYSFVKAGFRSLLHDTSVQDFLIKKFGFRKAFMN